MDNNQCESYGVLALNSVLLNRGVDDLERLSLLKEFVGEISFLFDVKTEEEAEEQAQLVRSSG